MDIIVEEEIHISDTQREKVVVGMVEENGKNGVGRKSDVSTSTNFAPPMDFSPGSFERLGSWLLAQERRSMRVASTQTDRRQERLHLSVPVLVGVVLVLLVLCGYWWQEARLWRAKYASLEESFSDHIAQEKRAEGGGGELALNEYHGGAEILDTCWLTVGVGACWKEVWEDPVQAAGGKWHKFSSSVHDMVASVFRPTPCTGGLPSYF